MIIIIVILGGAGAAYYFLKIKKPGIGKKREEKPSIFGGPMGPVARPIVRPSAPSNFGKPAASLSPRPLFRPQPKFPARPSSMPARPLQLKPLKPVPVIPAKAAAPAKSPVKAKSKTESDLEKTLSKLKKMSKK